MRYYAVRPDSYHAGVRIEKADSPERAYDMAFGRSLTKNARKWCKWKDLGTRVTVIRSDKKRIALLTDPNGWNSFKSS